MKHHLIIVLPEEMADIPVHVVKESGSPKRIVLSLRPEGADASFLNSAARKYALIWVKDCYAKIDFDDILWIKAEGSYSSIRLVRKKEMTVSFNLAVIEKTLPVLDFVRIHRSYIVNLRHVESLMGNSLKVEESMLTIGREYKENILEHFVFVGLRRSKR